MRSLSSVGIGLSIVFSCLFLALIAELYYLFWWKKRFTNNREIENDYSSSPAKELFYMFCWRKHSAFSHSALNPQELSSSSTSSTARISNNTLLQDSSSQLHLSSSHDLLFKPFGEDGMESEFMRLQNPSGPPRFLFTIIEETKEDLESEDGKSNRSRKESRNRSLSDLLVSVETPYLTPLASPPFFTPPLTPPSGGSYGQNGFNFVFESTTDAEFNRLRSSPPPKFKFLQEAEEKLKKRLMEEEVDNKSVQRIDGTIVDKGNEASTTISSLLKDQDDEEEEDSFITITVDKDKARDIIHHPHRLPVQYHSSTSQVLPLASSPSTFRSSPINKKLNLH